MKIVLTVVLCALIFTVTHQAPSGNLHYGHFVKSVGSEQLELPARRESFGRRAEVAVGFGGKVKGQGT
ncbi:hypothetical protein ElyMa_003009700 [Elysia marginata]|uniref:Uncharacterized protein n=1 Tax=Elysia marginata TaxID=1093978 RepID=A0AAV4ICL3_9GAST|nr:hypothetical protein ElyMa_003009700 [Elysia marginata]